jgi:hypothetical protein
MNNIINISSMSDKELEQYSTKSTQEYTNNFNEQKNISIAICNLIFDIVGQNHGWAKYMIVCPVSQVSDKPNKLLRAIVSVRREIFRQEEILKNLKEFDFTLTPSRDSMEVIMMKVDELRAKTKDYIAVLRKCNYCLNVIEDCREEKLHRKQVSCAKHFPLKKMFSECKDKLNNISNYGRLTMRQLSK